MEYKIIEKAPNYEISETGIVRRVDSKKVIKPFMGNRGYLRINLRDVGKEVKFQIHRAVAITFIHNDDPITRPQVNHKDGNKLNNHKDNLEWSTAKENINHSIDTGLTSTNIKVNVLNIDTNETTTYRSLNEAAKALGVSLHNVLTEHVKSKLRPMLGKYVITILNLDRIGGTKDLKTTYAYDHVNDNIVIYDTTTKASVYTGVNYSTIVDKLQTKPFIYIAGYTFTYDKHLVKGVDKVNVGQAKTDRDKILRKDVIVFNKTYDVKDYLTDKVYLGISTTDIFNKIDRLSRKDIDIMMSTDRRHKDKVAFKKAVGLMSSGKGLEFDKYGDIVIEKSLLGYKVSVEVFEVDGERVYGNTELSRVTNLTFDVIKGIIKKYGKNASDVLSERSGRKIVLLR